jgi:hypothetical protein
VNGECAFADCRPVRRQFPTPESCRLRHLRQISVAFEDDEDDMKTGTLSRRTARLKREERRGRSSRPSPGLGQRPTTRAWAGHPLIGHEPSEGMVRPAIFAWRSSQISLSRFGGWCPLGTRWSAPGPQLLRSRGRTVGSIPLSGSIGSMAAHHRLPGPLPAPLTNSPLLATPLSP